MPFPMTTAGSGRLAAFNADRFTPGLPHPGWAAEIDAHAALLIEEGHWLETRRASVAARASEAPRDPDGFVAWFVALDQSGPGQNDPLFPWLAEQATMDEMRWFPGTGGSRERPVSTTSPR